MLETLKKKRLSKTMLIQFLLFALFFPLCGSTVNNVFSPDLVFANIFVTAFIGLTFLEGNVVWNRRNFLVYTIIVCLLLFNIFSFYVNFSFFQWYAGQWNMTIAFVFLMVLLMMRDSAPCMGEDLIRFTLGALVITNLIGLIPGLLGYQGVLVSVSGLHLRPWTALDWEYSWIFYHKSEYSFFLILTLALAVTYRRLFPKRWMFWSSIAVFTACLILANTRVTLMVSLCILAGFLLDQLSQKAGGFRPKHLLLFVPFLLAGLGLLAYFSRERDVLSLGNRTYIWKASILRILDNPWGLGAMCGLQPFAAEGIDFEVWNCHNVFLNFLLQFSIPAGFFCIVIWGAIIIASIWKNRSFTTLGIWIALLVPMNMDWCLLLGQTPLILILIYFLFFHPLRRDPAAES